MPVASPRTHKLSALSPLAESLSSTEVHTAGGVISPLAKLFGFRQPTLIVPEANSPHNVAADATAAAVKKIENLLEDMRDLPVQRLRDEMKELQVRDA